MLAGALALAEMRRGAGGRAQAARRARRRRVTAKAAGTRRRRLGGPVRRWAPVIGAGLGAAVLVGGALGALAGVVRGDRDPGMAGKAAEGR